MPLCQLIECPPVQDDEQDEEERTHQVATQDIGEPVGALIHPRIANQEDIQRSIELEWDQKPAKAPLADRFGEAQIEHKPIIDDGIHDMTRGKSRNWLWYIHMDERRTRTWACDNKIDEKEERPHENGAKPDKNGSHEPGGGPPTP